MRGLVSLHPTCDGMLGAAYGGVFPTDRCVSASFRASHPVITLGKRKLSHRQECVGEDDNPRKLSRPWRRLKVTLDGIDT